jgi:hypothetical protein
MRMNESIITRRRNRMERRLRRRMTASNPEALHRENAQSSCSSYSHTLRMRPSLHISCRTVVDCDKPVQDKVQFIGKVLSCRIVRAVKLHNSAL